MISILSTATTTSFSGTDGGSTFGDYSGGDLLAGDWSFYDGQGGIVEPVAFPSYPDTPAGRRAELDDLGARIAAARARHGDHA